jgi:hypothetical protein
MKLTKRKGFNFFRSYYDVYNELDNESKVKFIDALLDRQFLGIKPDNLDGMAKFAYISQTNSIDSQVKGYEDKTKTKLSTPPTVGVKEKLITPTAQVQEKGKEKGKEEEKGEDPAPTPFAIKNALLDYGFKENLVVDWLKVRKKKRLTDSETAYKSFIKVIERASVVDKNIILEKCVEKSWGGLEYDWLINAGLIKEEGNKPFIYQY